MDKADGASSETIEFGGSPRWLRGLRGVRGATVEVALIALAAGVAIGFAGGRITAGPGPERTGHAGAGHAGDGGLSPIAFTGNRCATQLGSDLQLGIEIQNASSAVVMIRRISAMFALGGLRAVASGIGTCGGLPDMAAPTAALRPGGTEWVTITAAVRVRCPEGLPVGFRIGYAQAREQATTKINGFPDLGAVVYRNCGHEGQGGSTGFGKPVESGRGSSYSG